MEDKKTNPIALSDNLDENMNTFKNIFNNDATIIFRNLENQEESTLRFCIIYCEVMVNKDRINENIIKPLLIYDFSQKEGEKNLSEVIIKKVLTSNNATIVDNLDEVVTSIAYGDSLILVDGSKEMVLIDSKGYKVKGITEPSSESSVRGPNEGFTQSININISMIKRIIKNPNLKISFKQIGEVTKTSVCVCYIDGIANPKIVDEVDRRLDSINIDGILSTGYIQELIEDKPYGLFQTISSTERPDSVAGKLLEGRVAIISDGTPFVLTVPFLFIEYFQASEDYYNRYLYATLNRFLRYSGFFLTTSVPAIYLALISYHQQLIPTPLLISISAARHGVPFPTIVEIILMLFIFEVLREAGTRLPKTIGQTISIVGALVLGDAAVNAKIVSPIMVIIVATTGISSFLISKMQAEIIYIRLIFLLLAALLGLYGYIFGVFGLIIYLCSLRSFGVPYMLNVGAFNMYDIKDTIIRTPWWYMKYRPKLIGMKRPIREVGNKPKQPKAKKEKI